MNSLLDAEKVERVTVPGLYNRSQLAVVELLRDGSVGGEGIYEKYIPNGFVGFFFTGQFVLDG